MEAAAQSAAYEDEQTQAVIGIDLHGTILDPKNWEIPEDLIDPLVQALTRVIQKKCRVVLCTGNDLSFILENNRIPKPVRELLDGYVLETGCSFSDGQVEKCILETEESDKIQELASLLQEDKIQDVLFFGRRLGTISLFTNDHGKGRKPTDEDVARIKARVKAHGYEGKVKVTRSDVAVDIIPVGNNKYTGMKKIRREGEKIIGIADSWNDHALLENADHAYIPKNASSSLIKRLEKVIPIEKANNLSNYVVQTKHESTLGVIEALNHIADHL